jgi:hypothetical protein
LDNFVHFFSLLVIHLCPLFFSFLDNFVHFFFYFWTILSIFPLVLEQLHFFWIKYFIFLG